MSCSNSKDEESALDTEAEESVEEAVEVEEDTAKMDREIKIGVAFKTLREEVWESERIQLLKRADETEGVELVYTDAGNDATLQNDQVENLIAQEIDILLIAPVNNEGAAASVSAAKEAGIPVISYTDVVMSDQLDYIVTFDYYDIGVMNAEHAIENVPTGKYVLLNGEDADSLPHDINRGYHEILDPHVESGEIEIVFDQYMPHWSADEALAAMENVLTKHGDDIQAVLCNNDGIATGAIQALTAQGIAGDVYVAGMDGELSALQRIVEETQYNTVYTGHEPYADIVFDTALEVAKGEEPSMLNATYEVAGKEIPTVYAKPIFVNRDNIIETMIEPGIVSIEDVFANIPKDQWPK